MPPPRKVDLLPEELRKWLKDALRRKGFSDYEQIAEDLNLQLKQAGVSLTIGKSAIHSFGQEYQEFVKYQDEAGAWAQSWLSNEGLSEEANRHSVLFQMLTTLAFKFMRGQMVDGQEIDPKELHFIGRMMKDIMASSGMREKLRDADRAEQSVKLAQAVDAGQIDKEAAQAARRILGFEEK